MIFNNLCPLGNWCGAKDYINDYLRHHNIQIEGKASIFDWINICDYNKLIILLRHDIFDMFKLHNLFIVNDVHVENNIVLFNPNYSLIYPHLFHNHENIYKELNHIYQIIIDKINHLIHKFIDYNKFTTLYIIRLGKHYQLKDPYDIKIPNIDTLIELFECVKNFRGNDNFKFLVLYDNDIYFDINNNYYNNILFYCINNESNLLKIFNELNIQCNL
jgi:hypothetical protein